jgi:hypothetical protein
VTNAGLGREVDHVSGPVALEDAVQRRGLRDVELLEFEAGGACELAEASTLERRIVVVVEVVHPDDPVADVEQPAGHVHADESGGTGDEDGRSHSGVY